jgi:NADPH:quinone reductase-like Zn-dependent oxidoreductase
MKLKRVIGWGAAGIAVALLAVVVIAYFRSTNRCYDGSASAPATPVKAIVYCDYGSPNVLRVENIEKPVPNDNQVLVRVRAAAVNPLDWHYMRGTPYIGRLGMGLRKPAETRLGVDFAGVVEAVGKNVTKFKPGDEVFGGRTGALGEYVTVGQDRGIVLKPANVSFEQAAAIPVAGITALQAVRDKGEVKPGQKVLINGASGGVGTFAVQIAKSFGAHVTGVSSTRNLELVRSIGADGVIDYTKEDFTKRGERYDVIIDNVGNHSLGEFRSVLKPEGKYIMVGGPSGRVLDPLPRAFHAMILSRFVSQDMLFFISNLNQQDLSLLAELVQTGKVKPVIDRRYRFSEAREAIRYLEGGRARGKVIVAIN